MKRRGGLRGAAALAVTAAESAADDALPKQFDPAWLACRLQLLLGGALRSRRLCVAYSGGMDSVVLLAALAGLRTRERFALRALHVNHGLQPQAGTWAKEAARAARHWRVRCDIIDLQLERRRGESLEAMAREARYRALAARLEPGELLLTAHHREDQLETVLLALLRGSGVRGLAAMRAVTVWADTLLLRPLLPLGRSQLEHYAQAQGLTWSEDGSNSDQRFDRNFMRHSVLPLLKQRWPAAAVTVSRSAAHLAEASELLDQLARGSLRDAHDGAALRVSVLRRLPLPERRNALRQWIAESGLPMPDHRRLREIAGPMLEARRDAQPLVRWHGGGLRRHGDRLFAFVLPTAANDAHSTGIHGGIGGGADAGAGTGTAALVQWDWRTQPWLALADGGELGLLPDRHGDVCLNALPNRLSVRFRHGGERLQIAQGRLTLKDLLQAKGILPWQRSAIPLIVHDERIIAVADLWLDQHYRATATATGTQARRGRFRWRPPATAAGAAVLT